MSSRLAPSTASHETATQDNPRSARILDAASRCFSQKGFHATTIIDVAEAAGVSRPLVYKYFGGKDGLIESVLEQTFSDWTALHVETASEERSSGAQQSTRSDEKPGAARALEEKITRAVEFVRARPIFGTILREDPQLVVRGHLENLRRSRAISLERTREILRAGQDSGEFRADLDHEETAASIEMILFGLLERELGIRPELALTRPLFQATIDLVVAGLLSAESTS